MQKKREQMTYFDNEIHRVNNSCTLINYNLIEKTVLLPINTRIIFMRVDIQSKEYPSHNRWCVLLQNRLEVILK